MRAVIVVIADVLRKQSFQMPLVHGYDVVEQVPAAAFDPALRNALLPRALKRHSDKRYLQGSNRCGNLDSVLPVPVTNSRRRGAEPKGNASRSCWTTQRLSTWVKNALFVEVASNKPVGKLSLW